MMNNVKKVVTGFILAFFVLASGSSVYAQDKQKVKRVSLMLGAQSEKSSYGGFVDLSTGEVYNLKDASSRQKDIDIFYAHSKRGIILFTPSSRLIKQVSRRYNVGVREGWSTKSRGTFILLGDDKQARKVYRRVKTNAQLKKAYEEAELFVKSLPDYKSSVYGPAGQLIRRKVGDYFLFRSREQGRDVYAIGHIVNVKEGLQGEVAIDLKILGK